MLMLNFNNKRPWHSLQVKVYNVEYVPTKKQKAEANTADVHLFVDDISCDGVIVDFDTSSDGLSV